MIEIGYDNNIKDINKIKKYKNPTMDIYKNKLNDNSKYKIFLNKTQFNDLLKNNNIKYRLTDSKIKKLCLQMELGHCYRWYYHL